jgi:tetratricopeptide (TPR) repeat protein
MECPVCQTTVSGTFCPSCGAPGSGARCKACEGALLAGANFCTGCGTAVRAAASPLPWYVAGVSLTALIAVLLFPALRPGGRATPDFGALGPAAAAMAEGGAMPNRAPPLTGTPREQADRLFNRVMQAQAQADTQQIAFFLPMAVLAYQQVGDLDTDGLYHLSVLETAAGQAASGLASAEQILDTHPDHLLGLAAAAQAADALGKPAVARRYYERLLERYEAERGKPFPEYQDHGPVLPSYRQEAEAYLKR